MRNTKTIKLGLAAALSSIAIASCATIATTNIFSGGHNSNGIVACDNVTLITSLADSPDDMALADAPNTIFDMRSISGKLTWNDSDDAEHARPNAVSVSLFSYDTNSIVATHEVSADTNWEYSFDNVAATDECGEKISYKVIQDDVLGYATESNGYDFANTRALAGKGLSIAVNLEWDDDEDRDGLRPDSVMIELDRSNEDRDDIPDEQRVIELSADNDWSYTFTDIMARPGDDWMLGEAVDARTNAEYSFDEMQRLGELSTNHTINIKNVHVPYTTDIIVNNVWEVATDADSDAANFRPQSVTASIEGDNGYHNIITITESDSYDGDSSWQGCIAGLPRFCDGGKEIEYKIKEGSVYIDDESRAKYDAIYERDVDEEAVILEDKPRYDEEALDNDMQASDDARLANEFANRYMQLTADGSLRTIPEYDQTWYEGDVAPAPRTDAGQFLNVSAMPEGTFTGWEKLAGANVTTRTVANLVGETQEITSTTYTYRPVMETKYWMFGEDAATKKKVLLICHNERPAANDMVNYNIAGKSRTFKVLKTGLYTDDTTQLVNDIPANTQGFTGTYNLAFTHPYYDSGEMRQDTGEDSMKASPWGRELTEEEMRAMSEFAICDDVDVFQPRSCAGWFTRCASLTKVDMRKADMSACVNGHDMFNNCRKLRISSKTVLGIEKFDFASMRESGGMLSYAQVSEQLFSDWYGKTFPVLERAPEMFVGMDLVETDGVVNVSFSLPKLTEAWRMFSRVGAFTDVSFTINAPVVKDVASMFNSYENVKTMIVNMDFTSVQTATKLFKNNHAMKSIKFTHPQGFTMPNATLIGNLFDQCYELEDIPGITDVVNYPLFRCNNAQNIAHLLAGCRKLGTGSGAAHKFVHMEGINFSKLDENKNYWVNDFGGETEKGYDRVFKTMNKDMSGIYIAPNCETKAKKLWSDMVSNRTFTYTVKSPSSKSVMSVEPFNVMSALVYNVNAITIPSVYANYAQSGFVVRHAGETADKGQGRTLGDKKLVLTIHHRIKKIEGSPVVSPVAVAMPPASLPIPEAPTPMTTPPVPSAPISGLGDHVAEIAIIVVALSAAAGIACIIHRRRKS